MNDKKGIICRILILDIFKKKKEGELIGSSPEEEYRYYKKRFLSNKLYVKKILAEYPELYRLYKVRSSKMSFLKKKMKEHLLDDDIQLDFILLKKGNKKVKRLVLHKGDIHRGGFCVSKIEFDNGSILYYKPHSLDKDIKYQQLYKYLCEKAGISCREVKCLSRPTYGWEENIENKSCNTKEEIERYYFRLGIHLFLGYALGATDLHGENIVAYGEHPVIIDMETYPGYITKNSGSSTEEKAEIKIREKIMTSVLNTGILRAVSTLFHNEREKKICLCHGMTGNLLIMNRKKK